MMKMVNGVLVDMTQFEITNRELEQSPEAIAAQLADAHVQVVERIKSRFDDFSGTDRVLLKIAFLQENRIRVLEGRPEITKEQFRTWVDAQI